MYYYLLGVQKVLANPPQDFLGKQVECEAVNESEIDIFPGSSPHVLLIRNLPLKSIPQEVMQQGLEMMFKHAGGHELTEMKVVDGDVYIQFSNPKGQYNNTCSIFRDVMKSLASKCVCTHVLFSMHVAVRALVKNPPSGSTFLGSPVEYLSVRESDIPDNRPHVLVITGFSPWPSVDVAMTHYLNRVVQKDILSINVVGNEILVKFANAQGNHCYVNT